MPSVEKWVDLFRSEDMRIRIRAARCLLRREDALLNVLLEILDELSYEGLGASAEKALLRCKDPEMFVEMTRRLDSNQIFSREVACNVLGRLGDNRATEFLLKMIDDDHMMVRRAAGAALAHLMDRSAIPELRKKCHAHRHDDSNVTMVLKWALDQLEAEDGTLKS